MPAASQNNFIVYPNVRSAEQEEICILLLVMGKTGGVARSPSLLGQDCSRRILDAQVCDIPEGTQIPWLLGHLVCQGRFAKKLQYSVIADDAMEDKAIRVRLMDWNSPKRNSDLALFELKPNCVLSLKSRYGCIGCLQLMTSGRVENGPRCPRSA